MKRLVVILEGDSELQFVNSILLPYLIKFGILSVDCFKIKHSKGGLSKYGHLKKDILNVIYESNSIVTTLVDFYALPTDFPRFADSAKIVDKSARLDFLEQSIKEDLELTQNRAFDNLIPYIQLHEFEAFAFSSLVGIQALFESSEVNMNELESIVKAHPNPEDINDNYNTAPSKRLIKNIKGYSKVIDGVSIIDDIGIETVIKKCPRFRRWINKIVEIMAN